MQNLKSLKLSKLVLIGASTGGPSHIRKILNALPANFTPTVVVAQHMADGYIRTFAAHMNTTSKLKVEIAQNAQKLEPSTVYVTSNLSKIIKKDATYEFLISQSHQESYNPNINELYSSCARIGGEISILACILTGIGEDGANGMRELCDINAKCIAESEESAIVYGMPLRAKEVSGKVKVESLDEIINSIQKFGE